MKIKNILKSVSIKSNDNTEVFEIYDNSKEVTPNSIYVALGNNKEKQQFIDEAIEKGAKTVLSDTKNLNSYYVQNLKEKLVTLCEKLYGKIKIKLIGITGTNGKTTLAYFIHQKLSNSWLITTIEGIKDSTCFDRTTPTLIQTYKVCKNIEKLNKRYLIMEVSSIGYKEKRVHGLSFSYVILTNLGTDHLDYHKTLEEYHNAKISFINSQKDAFVIAYKDNIKINQIKNRNIKLLNYQDIIINKNNSEYVFEYNKVKYLTNVPFEINIKNIVLMIELLRKLRIQIPVYLNLGLPRGRYEIVSNNPIIIIDYAHTIDALNELYNNVKKEYKDQKIITVIGAGGNRDKSKRNEYGKIALKNSFLTIFTDDNPRNEDEKEIVDMMIKNNKGNHRIILNRKKAISYAIKNLNNNKLLLVIGKGHERFQEIKGIKYPFDDREVIEKCLMK